MTLFFPVLLSGKFSMPRSKLDLGPSKVEDFAQPASGEKQEAHRRARERRNDGLAVALWDMLGGRLRFRLRPQGTPTVSAYSDHRAEPFEFLGRQKPFTPGLRENLSKFPRRVDVAGGQQAALFGEGKHRAHNRDCPVRRDRMALSDLHMQLGDHRPANADRLHSAYVWKDMAMQIVPIEGGRGRLALRWDLIEIAFGKVADGDRLARFDNGRRGIVANGDLTENPLRLRYTWSGVSGPYLPMV